MSYYHTPTSFPVQTQADKTHEYLTVMAFSPDILLLHIRPHEVIAPKAESVPASDYKSSSKCYDTIPTPCSTLSLPKPLLNTILNQLHRLHPQKLFPQHLSQTWVSSPRPTMRSETTFVNYVCTIKITE
jgi:hypothetical protein